jgi:D-sedoheptulose 7-phosphate isomerase
MTADEIRERLADCSAVLAATADALAERIADAAGRIVEALRAGGGVFAFGNGGSAADAQHLVAELTGRFLVDRPGLRAEALTTNASALTSIANDYGYEAVFARQLAANARAGDVAIGLSTSGSSPNVVAALGAAREMGVVTIALTGRGGGDCAAVADVLLDVPADLTPRIQEAHAVIYHTLCEIVENAFAD